MRILFALITFMICIVTQNISFALDDIENFNDDIETTYNLAKGRLDSGQNIVGHIEYKKNNNFISIMDNKNKKAISIIKSDNDKGYMVITHTDAGVIIIFTGNFFGKGQLKGNMIEFNFETTVQQIGNVKINNHIKINNIMIENHSCIIGSNMKGMSNDLFQKINTAFIASKKVNVKIIPQKGIAIEQIYNIDGYFQAFEPVMNSFLNTIIERKE